MFDVSRQQGEEPDVGFRCAHLFEHGIEVFVAFSIAGYVCQDGHGYLTIFNLDRSSHEGFTQSMGSAPDFHVDRFYLLLMELGLLWKVLSTERNCYMTCTTLNGNIKLPIREGE